MITIRVTIEHDDDTIGEPRNVLHEAMIDKTNLHSINVVVKELSDAAVRTFTAIDREPEFGMKSPSYPRPIQDRPQA